MIETQRNHYLKSVEVAQESLVNYSTERLIAEHKEHHKKANEYFDKFVDEIKDKYGQDTLDELYERVDHYQKKLAGNGLNQFGFDLAFNLCAEEVRESYNKEQAMFVFICFLEETFEHIIDMFSDMQFFEQTLKNYDNTLIKSYEHLDETNQHLMGELYPEYLHNVINNEY